MGYFKKFSDFCALFLAACGVLYTFGEFMSYKFAEGIDIKEKLSANGLRYVSGGRDVFKIACCGGAGAADMMKAYEMGCDTYVTSDLKYDHFLLAKELGLNLIDADHFCTENVVVPVLRDKLKEKWEELEVEVSAVHGQTIKFA